MIEDISEELAIFRRSAVHFVETEVVPHLERFREQRMVDRDLWRKAGEAGLLLAGTEAPWGAGGDIRHEVIFIEELARAGFPDFGVPIHSGIVAPYIAHCGTAEQKDRWLPALASGDMVAALAMTEPGAGSDLRGIRTTARLEGEEWVLNGAKTFITNGHLADLIVVACRTEAEGSGLSLIVIETEGLEGFRRGRNLEKIGFKASDTAELFFDECRVPAGNILGERGRGLSLMMNQLPQERLLIAVQAVGAMEGALEQTIAYTKERQAFGRSVFDFQNTKFKLAEAKATTVVARTYIDRCILDHAEGNFSATDGAIAKYWTTEKQGQVIDECLQLFGGYGYMAEYPISHAWVDARVQRIYAGTNEIMKELISRSL
jgi:acyl-CoA dehydrogenase